ncbi:MAG: beta strand repeat-containing protein [Bacillota bacterium]
MIKRIFAIILILSMILTNSLFFAAKEDLTEDVEIVASLGMLKGEGDGVTEEYAQSVPSRLQAAIMFLRLKGLENDALKFKGIVNFNDADQVTWSGGRAIMAYLKAHPELGWGGENGSFVPYREMSAKEYYKVMLEALGYRQTVQGMLGDFTWNNVLDFANSLGLGKSAYVTNFTITDLAAATVEALKTQIKDEGKTLINKLVDQGIIPTEKLKLVSENLMALSVMSGTVTNETTIVVSLYDNVSEKLASDIKQYNATIDGKELKITNVKYDELTKKAVLTVDLKGKSGVVKVNGLIMNTVINLTSLKIEKVSGIDSSSYIFYVKLSEYPTYSIVGKRILLVKNNLVVNATCTGMVNLEAVFEIDLPDRDVIENGIYVIKTPAEDNWLKVESMVAVFPSLAITSVSTINSSTKIFSVNLSEYPSSSLTGKKLILQSNGVDIYATFTTIYGQRANFIVDVADRSKLVNGVYILAIPENDRWASVNGLTTSYSTSNYSIDLSYASYDISTGKLTLTGSGFKGVPGPDNDIDAKKIVIRNGTDSYTLKSTSGADIYTTTSATLTLSEADKAEVSGLLTQNGTDAGNGYSFLIEAQEAWNGPGSMEDSNGNLVYVSGYPASAVTSVTYNSGTGAMVISGTSFRRVSGSNNDVNPQRFTIQAVGGRSYTLTSATAAAEINDENSVTLQLDGRDRAEINDILNKNGTANTAGQVYNIQALSDWNGSGSGEDLSSNPITVNAYSAPILTGASYDYNSGVLTLTGTGFRALSGATNDINVQKLTISAGSSYTISSATANVEVANATTAIITLSTADRTQVNGILDKDGTQSAGGQSYNIAAAAEWNGAGSLDDLTGNAITVVGYQTPTIASAAYNFATGQLSLTGANLRAIQGANNDILADRLTISAGGSSYTLTAATSNAEITSATSAVVTVAGIDRAQLNAILNSNGTADGSANTYNLAAAAGWNGSGVAADLTGNGITVSNYAAPVLTSAAYDFSTGQLTLTGDNLRSVTGAANDINAATLIVGDGAKSYMLTAATSNVEVTNSTTAVLTVNGIDRAYLNWIFLANGQNNGSGGTYNIGAGADWNGTGAPADLASNGITVSNYAAPVITNAVYDSTTGVLTLTGGNLRAVAGANNDIDVTMLTISDGTVNRTLTADTTNADVTNAATASITIAGADKTAVDAILVQNGADNGQGGTYNVAAALNWNEANAPADLTGNGVTVSNVPEPVITSAAYDFSNGQLTLTGTNFRANTGANNDIDVTKLTISDGAKAYILTAVSGNVEITSRTTATITVNGIDRAYINWIFLSNGLNNGTGGTYNIAAAPDWNGTGSTADLTGNGITVSNYTAPAISNAAYDYGTGVLTITGSNLRAISGAANDLNVTKLTISDGTASYQLTAATANADVTNTTTVAVTVAGADRTALYAILAQNGTDNGQGGTYNLAAAVDWNGTGAGEDLVGNSITVNNVPAPAITSAAYDFVSGTLVLTGTNFKATIGAANDIIATKLTISDGTKTYTLTAATSDVEITSRSSATITVNTVDRAFLNWIFLANGLNNGSGGVYNIAAAVDWNGAGTAADTTGNTITVSNYAAAAITSAVYDKGDNTLTLTGTNLRAVSGAGNDINALMLTITDTSGTRTLTADTANVDVTNSTTAVITLGGADIAAVEAILTTNGTANGNGTYNLAAALNWNGTGAAADATTGITVQD